SQNLCVYQESGSVGLLSGIRTGMRARPRQSKVVDRSKCIAGPADNRPLALARWPRAGRSFSSPGRSVRRRNMGCRQIMELGPLHTGGGGCELIALPDHLYFRSAGTNSQPPNRGSALSAAWLLLGLAGFALLQSERRDRYLMASLIVPAALLLHD